MVRMSSIDVRFELWGATDVAPGKLDLFRKLELPGSATAGDRSRIVVGPPVILI